jgi:hypothetical protein
MGVSQQARIIAELGNIDGTFASLPVRIGNANRLSSTEKIALSDTGISNYQRIQFQNPQDTTNGWHFNPPRNWPNAH